MAGTNQREIVEGINVLTEDGVVLGKSKVAAKTAVAQVRRYIPATKASSLQRPSSPR